MVKKNPAGVGVAGERELCGEFSRGGGQQETQALKGGRQRCATMQGKLLWLESVRKGEHGGWVWR